MSSSQDSSKNSIERYDSSNVNVVSLDGTTEVGTLSSSGFLPVEIKGVRQEKGVIKSKAGTVARRGSVEALELAKAKCKSYKAVHNGSKHQQEIDTILKGAKEKKPYIDEKLSFKRLKKQSFFFLSPDPFYVCRAEIQAELQKYISGNNSKLKTLKLMWNRTFYEPFFPDFLKSRPFFNFLKMKHEVKEGGENRDEKEMIPIEETTTIADELRLDFINFIIFLTIVALVPLVASIVGYCTPVQYTLESCYTVNNTAGTFDSTTVFQPSAFTETCNSLNSLTTLNVPIVLGLYQSPFVFQNSQEYSDDDFALYYGIIDSNDDLDFNDGIVGLSYEFATKSKKDPVQFWSILINCLFYLTAAYFYRQEYFQKRNVLTSFFLKGIYTEEIKDGDPVDPKSETYTKEVISSIVRFTFTYFCAIVYCILQFQIKPYFFTQYIFPQQGQSLENEAEIHANEEDIHFNSGYCTFLNQPVILEYKSGNRMNQILALYNSLVFFVAVHEIVAAQSNLYGFFDPEKYLDINSNFKTCSYKHIRYYMNTYYTEEQIEDWNYTHYFLRSFYAILKKYKIGFPDEEEDKLPEIWRKCFTKAERMKLKFNVQEGLRAWIAEANLHKNDPFYCMKISKLKHGSVIESLNTKEVENRSSPNSKEEQNTTIDGKWNNPEGFDYCTDTLFDSFVNARETKLTPYRLGISWNQILFCMHKKYS